MKERNIRWLSISSKSAIFFFLNLGAVAGYSQTYVLPLDYVHYLKVEKRFQDSTSAFHTSIKPYFISEDTRRTIDSLDSIPDKARHTWAGRKLFQEYLIEVKKSGYRFMLDFLPDLWVGRDFADKKKIWLNSRGIQMELNLGTKVFISSSFYENQAMLPGYIDGQVRRKRVLPGQGVPLNYQNTEFNNNPSFDFPYATGYISFTPNKYLNIQLGQDKNVIGDGYRSMLLSDVSFNYPFLKANLTIGPVRYMAMWAQMQDPSAPKLSYDTGYRKKWSAFHYLDWNIGTKLSAGLFEAVIWQDADSTAKRGFDLSYLNPVILLRPTEYSLGSPDNALLGFNLKYRFLQNVSLYGQFLLDDFKFKELLSGKGYWKNQYAAQIGIKSYDLFKVKSLDILAEYNVARPYTYASRSSLLNYGHYNEPLAHPFGANFKELIGIANYQFNRFQVRAEFLFSKYGKDFPDRNFGGDILKPYETKVSVYGNTIGQGLNTSLFFTDIKIGYIIKPKTNLRLETGFTLRRESNAVQKADATVFTIGIRSAFKNIYYDF